MEDMDGIAKVPVPVGWGSTTDAVSTGVLEIPRPGPGGGGGGLGGHNDGAPKRPIGRQKLYNARDPRYSPKK
jgi:hypothetical protein